MTVIEDLADLIEAATIAPSDEIYVGRLPDDVRIGLQVREYGGRGAAPTHTGATYRYPRVQVVSRHTDPEVAEARAQAVWALLEASKRWDETAATLNGTEYQVIVPLSEVFVLSHDEARSANYACNYEVRYAVDVPA